MKSSILEDDLQCSICLEDFEETDTHHLLPRIFPCLAHHSSCTVLVQSIQLKKDQLSRTSNRSNYLPYLATAFVSLGAYTANLVWRCYFSKWSTLITIKSCRILN